MNRDISQLNRRVRQSRKRRKRRIWLFLNFFMLVCIWIVIFCIGVLQERNNEIDTDAKSFISSIAYTANESTVLHGEQKSLDNELESIDKVSEDFDHDWHLTLVNKWHPLPEKLEIETVELSNGERVDKRIYPYLQEMFDDAREEGICPIVRSGYRTRTEQEDIYNDRIQGYQLDGMSAEAAKAETELWVAVPGTSEHELGLAVDINADKVHSEGTQVYTWLENHAHLYGFINRYPPDKTEITGVANEPWHYRYVGVKAASEMHERGICLEEYLENE